MTRLRHAVAPLIIGAAVAAGAAACSPSHSTHVSASQSAAAKADAKALTAKCIPQSAGAQIELAHSLATQAGRAKLEATCGIAPSHKAAFEADVLSAAESGRLTSHSGRATFFAVTLPKIVEENQG
jgi:hypothetical protein